MWASVSTSANPRLSEAQTRAIEMREIDPEAASQDLERHLPAAALRHAVLAKPHRGSLQAVVNVQRAQRQPWRRHRGEDREQRRGVGAAGQRDHQRAGVRRKLGDECRLQ